MALTNEEIDKLVAGGFIAPYLADAMKRRNDVGAQTDATFGPGMAPTIQNSMAAGGVGKSVADQQKYDQQVADIAAMQKQAQLAKATRPVQPAGASSPIAASAPFIGTGPWASPYSGRADTAATGSPGYIAPVDQYGMQKAAKENGGVVTGPAAKAEGLAPASGALGPNGVAPGGAITTEEQFAKVPKGNTAAIHPELIQGLVDGGAITTETADKLHAMNAEEEKKKKKGGG